MPKYDLRCKCGKLLGKAVAKPEVAALRLFCRRCKAEVTPEVLESKQDDR